LGAGAKITFIDVVESNLLLVERVCRIKGIDGATFLKLNAFGDPLILSADYDAVFAIGSLHHAPSEVTKPEFEALASRLKLGGRFITLTWMVPRADGVRTARTWQALNSGRRTGVTAAA
jgi:SAM-dependent methyltransferase